MVGQTKLLESINKYTLQTLPRTMLFLGEIGCGKKTLVKMLADKFKLELVDLSKPIRDNFRSEEDFKKARDTWNNTISDKLLEAQIRAVSVLYLINWDNFTSEAEQTKFLKFIEEPNKYVYIALIAQNEVSILPTILNRCIKFQFEPYTLADLRQLGWFADNFTDDMLKICGTPGAIKNADARELSQLLDLSKRIVSSFNKANYNNALTIATKINYKDEYNKFDFNSFFKAIELAAFEDYLTNNSEQSFKIYQFTSAFKQNCIGKIVAKESFVLNYLTQLWELLRG